MGALTENHRCPRGPFSRVMDALSTVGIGAAVGGSLCYAIEDAPASQLVLAAAALGAVLASALRQALNPRG